MRSLIILFPLLLLLCWGCPREECRDADFGGAYQFVIPATLSPAKDTFRVGDTIHISSVFSDEVYERQTEEYYKLEDWRFYPTTLLDNIDKIDSNFVQDGLIDFDIIIPDKYNYNLNSYIDGSFGLEGQYFYENSRYSLEYNIVPLKPGLYFFCKRPSKGVLTAGFHESTFGQNLKI